MKIFISQPMNGLSTKEILVKRKEILKKFNDYDCRNLTIKDVVNPIERDMPKDATRLDYLGEAIKDMSKADVIIFATNSQYAGGCNVEYEVVRNYIHIYKWKAYREVSDGFNRMVFRRSE